MRTSSRRCAVAGRRTWQIIETYNDAGVSGAKGRDKRPGLDALLDDASRRKFDVVMRWTIDRLGRSLIDLLGTIQHLEVAGVDLYLDQQAIDTTTPMGKLLFQITGAFAEFERTMIRQQIHAGLSTVEATIARDKQFTAKSSGIVRKRLARPGADPDKLKEPPSCWARAWASWPQPRRLASAGGRSSD